MTSPIEHSSSSSRALSDAAVGAVVAFVRVVELYDPAVAHRAAIRALVADLVLAKIDPTADRSVAIASAALADIDLVVSRPADPEASHDATRSLLSATIVGRVPGLRNVAGAIGARRERWDGTGEPDAQNTDEIALGARIIALTDVLVGNPAAGFMPTWDHGLRRVRRNRGDSLDPQLCDAVASCDLASIETPPIPSAAVLDLLERETAAVHATAGTETATTIRSAVAAAGHTNKLMSLFAQTAQRTVSAAEVLIIELTSTHLESEPAASATDGQIPALQLERLDDLREFAMQAELRAGVTLSRSLDGRNSQGSELPGDDGGQINEMIVPIMSNGEAWGVIVATRRVDQPPFDDHELSILRHIAGEAAVAVSSTTHWAEMEQMALRDQLTGLANRHELYRVLDQIFARPPLERLDSALIMCDVDGLKVINDTLGHHAGDRLLIDAAAALRGAIRDAQRTTVCRIGGDEFCMVIDGGALLTAHDVSDMIERLFARSAGSGPPRSISCGIAFANDEITSRSALLRAADENQYQTKRARKAEREEIAAALDGTDIQLHDRRALRD